MQISSSPRHDSDSPVLYECLRIDCMARRRLFRSGDAFCIGWNTFRHPSSQMEAIRDDERGETPRAVLTYEDD